MLINPGLDTDIVSINSSDFLIWLDNFSANSIAVVLFILDNTIATLVDISQLNLVGGISAVIPFILAGKIKQVIFHPRTV